MSYKYEICYQVKSTLSQDEFDDLNEDVRILAAKYKHEWTGYQSGGIFDNDCDGGYEIFVAFKHSRDAIKFAKKLKKMDNICALDISYEDKQKKLHIYEIKRPRHTIRNKLPYSREV